MNFRIGETAGFEYETDSIPISRLPSDVGNLYMITHDASVETKSVPMFNGIPVSTTRRLVPLFKKGTLGGELVSTRPIERGESLEYIRVLTDWLKYQKTHSRSERSGIHFHISCAINKRIIEEIINLGAHLEASFFYLGGMGYDYRGATNFDSYAFPLTRPPVVRSPAGYVPLFVLEDIFKAETYSDILRRVGDIENISSRYVPIRYCAFNFYSLILRRSLEFRVFNTSLSSYAINAAMQLCFTFTNEALARSFNNRFTRRLEPHSIMDTSKEDAIRVMSDFMDNTNFEYPQMILQLMENTPTIISTKNLVFSHLMYHPGRGDISHEHYRGSGYRPSNVSSEDIIVPKTVQSHNLRYSYVLPKFMKIDFPYSTDNTEEEQEEDEGPYNVRIGNTSTEQVVESGVGIRFDGIDSQPSVDLKAVYKHIGIRSPKNIFTEEVSSDSFISSLVEDEPYIDEYTDEEEED